MSLYNQKHVLHVLVGKDLAAKTTGSVTAVGDLTDGQIAVVDRDNACLADLTTATHFKVIQRSGDSLLMSPVITKAKITSRLNTAAVAAVQQVSYIGYTGSAGAIQAINNNLYTVRILLQSTLAQFANKQMFKSGVYQSSSSATQQDVAHGLLDNLILNFKNEPEKLIEFTLLNSATVTSGNKFEANLAVVNGLTTVSAASGGEYGSNVAPVVGDYIRIGTVGGGTALTNSVYKITAISGTTTKTFTLDRAVVEATGTYATATADAEVIPAATAVAANFGIKLTGIARKWKLAVTNFETLTFEVYLEDFGTTVVTDSVAGKTGTGNGEQIAELQWFAQGNWGKEIRQFEGYPGLPQFNDADPDSTYRMIHITYYNDSYSTVAGTPVQPAELLVAVVTGTNASNLATLLLS